MKTIDYFLVTCLIFVILQLIYLIFTYTKRGSWEPVNKIHVISYIFYPIYLGFVVFMSIGCNHSDWSCDITWKVSSTLYIIVTMAVYFFYYTKSKISRIISWKGKARFERIEILMIMMMGVIGLGFFWLPIKDVQYNSFLKDGVCRLAQRQWIPIIWSLGDTVLSALLLWLFIKPLKEIEEVYEDTTDLKQMKELIQRTRNLLIIAVVVTFAVMLVIAIEDLNMLTVHYLCAIDRLVTLQSISLTFWTDGLYCFPCLQKSISEELTMTDEISTGLICCPCLFTNRDSSESSFNPTLKNTEVTSPSVVQMHDIDRSNIKKLEARESRSASFRV